MSLDLRHLRRGSPGGCYCQEVSCLVSSKCPRSWAISTRSCLSKRPRSRASRFSVDVRGAAARRSAAADPQAHAARMRLIHATVRRLLLWLRDAAIVAGNAISGLAMRLVAAYASRRQRMLAAAELGAMSDRDLKDIGVEPIGDRLGRDPRPQRSVGQRCGDRSSGLAPKSRTRQIARDQRVVGHREAETSRRMMMRGCAACHCGSIFAALTTFPHFS